ncbi:MAG: hypothetical protein JSS82_16690 [Bacteroidetes bacterium]|nr:hypothetical protein [Bacteroidota bacterium]
MKTFFYFLLAGLAWFLVFLTIDIQVDLLKATLISVAASIVTVIIIASLRKPVKKWFLRNFSKSYMMSRGYVGGKKKQS